MSSFEYNIIAILAAISAAIFILTKNKQDRSILAFLILYGINFLIVLFIFWLTKLLLR